MDMTNIKIDYDSRMSDEDKTICASICSDIDAISEDLDITGLSEMKFSSKTISTNSAGIECHIDGEIEILSSDPPNYRVMIYIFNNQNNWLNIIRHELAHIDDRNKIKHLYLFCELSDNKFYLIVIQIWSEFYATYKSSNYSNIDNIKVKVEYINSVLTDINNMERKESVKKKPDLMIFIARFIGEIINTEFSEKENKKIINTKHDIIIRRLYKKLDCLKDTYPKWDNEMIFNGLYDIITDFICENY